MELFFSKYRISTITSNANLFIEDYHENIKINLIELFNNLSINEKNSNNNFIFTSRFCKLTNSIIERGTYIKKKRSIKSKRTFDNQISFVFKVEDNYHLNTKVFQNGKSSEIKISHKFKFLGRKYYRFHSPKIDICKNDFKNMKKTQNVIWRTLVQVSSRDLCSGPIW